MLKKRVWKPIAGIAFFILLLSSIFFGYSLVRVDLLIAEYLLLILAVIAFMVILTGLLLYYGLSRKGSSSRRVRRIIGLVLSAIMSFGCLYGAFAMMKIESTKTAISTKPEGSLSARVGVYVKKNDAAQSVSDLGGYRVAILGELGTEKIHSEYAVARINEKLEKKIETISYPGITDAAAALRDGEVQAMAVNTIFLSLLRDTESLNAFAEEIRLVEEIPVPDAEVRESGAAANGGGKGDPSGGASSESSSDNQSAPDSTRVFEEDEPFVIYLSGVDSRSADVFNTRSDGNILMLVNPVTRQILLINTPRDTFLTNPALGDGDKLTHCAIQGTYNSIAALERFYGVEIDNYIKVNFAGFIKIVDSLGGITLENPVAFDGLDQWDNRTIHFDQGTLTLDGARALSFARERKSFGSGDLERGNNQMRVIRAMIVKAKSTLPSLLLNYQDFLDSLADCMETDISSSQISDLFKIALRNLSDWEIKSYGLTGVSGMRVTASGGSEPLYILWPQQNSIDYASKLMNMLLRGELITDEVLAGAP